MSYVAPAAILMIVLLPLLIPVTVTVVHAIVDQRRTYELLRTTIGSKIRAITPLIGGRSVARIRGTRDAIVRSRTVAINALDA
jgi:hypothetical protein